MTTLTLPASGRCQCGRVTYELAAQAYVAYTCHCRACQRFSSSAFATCMQVPLEALRVTSGQPALTERTAATGNVCAMWFCESCGSALYSHNSARPRISTLYVGTLDDAALVRVSAHIWVERKLPWVVLPAGDRVFERAGDWTRDYGPDIDRYEPGAPAR